MIVLWAKVKKELKSIFKNHVKVTFVIMIKSLFETIYKK